MLQDWSADDAAFDSVEALYASLKNGGRVPVAPLIELYEDKEIELAFKQALALQLMKMYASEGLDAPVRLLDSARNKIKWFLILAALPLWIFVRMRWLTRRSNSRTPVQTAFRVYTTDWGLRGRDTRETDWLVDRQKLRPDNTLFVIEKPIDEGYRTELAARGYQIDDVSGAPAMLFRGLGAWMKLLIASLRAPGLFVEVAARGWLEYLRWTEFLSRRRPRHYVVYNHFHFEHLFRNSLLRAAGCQSWYYVHSVNDRCAFLHASPDRSIRTQVWWTYLSYDHEVHWGRRDEELYRGGRGHSRSYHVWGPLWSSHVRPVSTVSEAVRSWRSDRKVDALVAIFDSSIGPTSPYGEAGVREFYHALTDLLDRPDWASRGILFKAKEYSAFSAHASPQTSASLERLLKHPRCLRLEDTLAPGLVIAEADLTISIAYTSTTVEALGARRRAFFFDPGGKFPYSYYDRFPDLVAHDREALRRLCEHWLRTADADFQKYLEHYVAPEFGGHLDSGAVTRFREALSRG